jgi:hypothetical protein
MKKYAIWRNIILMLLFFIGIVGADIGFYTFLRIAVFIGLGVFGTMFSWLSYLHDSNIGDFNMAMLIAETIIVILFNPFAPIYLDRDVWVIIDVVCVLFLIIKTIKTAREKDPPPLE